MLYCIRGVGLDAGHRDGLRRVGDGVCSCCCGYVFDARIYTRLQEFRAISGEFESVHDIADCIVELVQAARSQLSAMGKYSGADKIASRSTRRGLEVYVLGRHPRLTPSRVKLALCMHRKKHM